MFEPTNEQGTIFVFAAQAEQAGWRVIEIGCPFPDATLEYKGEIWKVEFEFKAFNFSSHRHDIRGCDLIICWENDFPDCPLPVIELRNENWTSQKITRGNPLLNEITFWKQKAISAENKLGRLRAKVSAPPSIHPQKNKPTFVVDKTESPEQEENLLVSYYRMYPLASQRGAAKDLSLSQSKISRILSDLESRKVIHRNGNGVEILS